MLLWRTELKCRASHSMQKSTTGRTNIWTWYPKKSSVKYWFEVEIHLILCHTKEQIIFSFSIKRSSRNKNHVWCDSQMLFDEKIKNIVILKYLWGSTFYNLIKSVNNKVEEKYEYTIFNLRLYRNHWYVKKIETLHVRLCWLICVILVAFTALLSFQRYGL